MARSLTGAMVTELTADMLRPVLFYQGEFASGFVRLWSGYGTKSWNGQNWLGAGELVGIGPIEETAEVKAAGVVCTLSGIPASLLSTALADCRLGKTGNAWLGCLDANGAVIADPFLAFQGRLDVCREMDSGLEATIILTYESRLAALTRPRLRRWTPEDQHVLFTGDLGFDFVPKIQEWSGRWGR